MEIEIPQNIGNEISDPWREKYEAVLRSEWWTKTVRPKILERAGGRCEYCGKSAELQVHHLTYKRLGEERPSDVMALCERCHEIADRYREIRNFAAFLKKKFGYSLDL